MFYTTASQHLQKLWKWPYVHSVEKSSCFEQWMFYINITYFVLPCRRHQSKCLRSSNAPPTHNPKTHKSTHQISHPSTHKKHLHPPTQSHPSHPHTLTPHESPWVFTGGPFPYKYSLSGYGDSHYKDKTVVRDKYRVSETDWSHTRYETTFSWRHKGQVTSQITDLIKWPLKLIKICVHIDTHDKDCMIPKHSADRHLYNGTWV